MTDGLRFKTHKRESASPVLPGERIAFVDILRGFAMFGILVANMADFSGHTTDLQAPLVAIDRWVLILVRFLITAKFYSLFSFLFGWGMSVQMARAEARGTSFVSPYLRRMLVLLLIGLLHVVLIWDGDILAIYALFGCLLLLVRNRSARTFLIMAALCLLLSIILRAPWDGVVEITARYGDLTAFLRREFAPGGAFNNGSYLEIAQLRVQEYLKVLSPILYFFGNVFSMFLLGLWTGKRRIFQDVERQLPFLYKVMLGGFIVGVFGNALNVWLIRHPGEMPVDWLPLSYHRMVEQAAYTLGAPALMLFYVSGLILLMRSKYWQNLLSPLANVGRMALSNYLFQSIVATLIFYNYGLGLYGQISPTVGLLITLFIFLAQIRLSEWWLDRHAYGPVEWVWRFLTYGRSPHSAPEISGAPAEITGRLQSVIHFTKRLPPAWRLGAAWIILLVWAGSLVAWNQQIQAASRAPQLRLVYSASGNPESSLSPPAGEEESGETGSTSSPVLTFSQRPYLPGEIAASGDVEALVGTFDLEKALDEIAALTGAPYGGRLAGSPQGWAAGEYLASLFSSYGLQPLGDQGAFFQDFNVLYTPLESTPRLFMESSSVSSAQPFVAYQDFAPVVRWYAGSGEGQGQVYWANRCAEEDFAARDLVDKVLLCLPDTSPNWLERLSRRALEHGATALLFLTDPQAWPPDFGWSFKDVWVPEPIPVFYVYPEMVTRLLAGSDKTAADLLSNAPPFLMESVVGFEIKTQQGASCPGTSCLARNVIGILPGRDPAYAGEAIILGAHYDHMGQAPDGMVWPGANDDASGVAVLLEIARSWREQGYVPRRSVIFAAWDAEELGLLGSIHYVQHPPFPLENTIAMIQMDMVGAGLPVLDIDGRTPVSQRIQHIAETMGIEATITDFGRSDHVPFLSSEVPASALIWEFPTEGEITYHRPRDTVQAIDSELLHSAAQIAELTVLDLAESEPSILQMLASRARAAQEGDLEAFLSSSRPDQVQNDSRWFQALQSLQPETVSLQAGDLMVAGNQASANVTIHVDYLDSTENVTRTLNTRIPVALAHGPRGWQWGGAQVAWNEPEASQDQGTVFQVGYPPAMEGRYAGVGEAAIQQYQRLAGVLGLPAQIQAKLLILPDEEVLWASTDLSQPRDREATVTRGEIRLAYHEAISASLRLQDTLVQLALAEAGVSEALAPWLWQGLPFVYQGYDQPLDTQIRLLPALHQGLMDSSLLTGEAYSWAATAYLQERLGWSGLGSFILRLGQMCQEGCDPEQALDAALLEFLARDAEDFESAWQSAWRARLETAQGAIDSMLSRRSLAFSNGDRQLLLETIDRTVPNLESEELHWLEDFQANPVQRFTIQGQPLAFLEGGSLLAQVTMEYQLAEGDETSISFNALLAPGEAGYRWAGTLVERLPGERVEILYPAERADLAAALLVRSEEIYSRLVDLLGLAQADKVIIKLYATPDSYRASISLSLPPTLMENAWVRPGESLKLNALEGGDVEYDAGLLAYSLSRSLLYQGGVKPSWFVEGVSAYLSRPYDIESGLTPAWGQTARLFEVASSGSIPALGEIQPTVQVSSEGVGSGRSVARDAVDFLVSNYGWHTLMDILDSLGRGARIEDAFQASLGIALEQFEQNWRDSLLSRHLRPEWAAIAQAFTPERAMHSVDDLSSPALEGRLAGSPGSLAAAQYIARAFDAYGLLPAGDLMASIATISATNSISEALPGFFQSFPISYTYQASLPGLDLLSETGETMLSLTYRQDYSLVDGEACNGSISTALVWGGDQAYPDIDLGGKIILRSSRGDLPGEIEAATSHGAAALLLTSFRWDPEELFAKGPLTPQAPSGASIPVFELTQPGFMRLLEALGYDLQSIGRVPAFQTFGGSLRLECHPYRFESMQTANVLGLLPGADPYLSQEVIILGAHYDYVGDDLGGARYSGRNDNASGVAVLLEIARLFHELGYRPKRSLLFAAWGAQEQGQIGSTYYITDPLYPLRDTIAMIQLDGVGGGDGFNLGVQGSEETDGELLFYLSAVEWALQEKIVYTSPFVTSDDVPFRQARIPAALVSWRLANEDNLPDDLANAVRPERLGIAGRVVTLLALALGR